MTDNHENEYDQLSREERLLLLHFSLLSEDQKLEAIKMITDLAEDQADNNRIIN